MRLCRMLHDDLPVAAFLTETHAVPVSTAADSLGNAAHPVSLPARPDDLIALLGQSAPARNALHRLYRTCSDQPTSRLDAIGSPLGRARLLTPIERPPKLLLLAGNYAEHVKEDGSRAEERHDTFPYFFMKPSTTLLGPGASFAIPASSPDAMDWEAELAVVIGRKTRNIAETEALDCVAGYTLLNDLSDRRFRPNPGRRERDWDKFFDWMHGKWHDGSAPCGPCLATSESVPDPQNLRLQLTLNGELRQDGSTADQIFPVAAVISFISRLVTLEPGDIISTGTPAGVGSTTGTFLATGDIVEVSCPEIGTLTTPIAREIR
ncbi:fumarylacetoacetate hydrolase family protein [Elongatibacter sediminis]|uniref:Fumarylacetoacetate hydrolase family protein n=1 Tax=Elongatibacter sediminis TaxID=3119006 RepID=A0AAW9RI80_9GAMM